MNELFFPPPAEVGGLPFDFRVPTVMGILNITPDSFSDGGHHTSVAVALRRAETMVADGARIVDVGGESTRPGAQFVDEATERARVIPILDALIKAGIPAAISIDTRKASVALAALEHGASIVNDVSALGDPRMAQVVADARAFAILMHMRGDPTTMQQLAQYTEVTTQVCAELTQAVEKGEAQGIARDKLWVDPGLGFAKQAQHNLSLTRHLAKLSVLRCPIVYGASRKGFLGELTGRIAAQRDEATAAACVAAILAGAHVVRVHNPAAVYDALRIAAAIRDAH